MAKNNKNAKKQPRNTTPPPAPKDTSLGKTPPPRWSQADIAASDAARRYDLQIQDMQLRLQNMRGEGFGAWKPSATDRQIREMESRIDLAKAQSPALSRYNPNRPIPSNISVPRLPGRVDPMSGRTVDAGTRSMLQGMIRFLRGGGGPLLRGK